MKYWAIALALAVAFALLPSCQEKSETHRRIVVTAIGIDQGDGGDCRVSIQAVETLKTSGSLTEQENNPTVVYELEGPSVAGTLDAFVTRTGRSTYILHNRAVAIGLEQAKELLLTELLDYFIRNQEGRPTVDMVLCRGEASQLLAVPSAGYTLPAEQLSMLLQEGELLGYGVAADLLNVERGASGMFDVALPIVRVEGEGEEAVIEADGTAVFRQGTYAGELDKAATRGLLFGRGDLEQCTYILEQEDGSRLTLQVESSRTNVSLTRAGLAADFRLSVRCRARILEEYGPGLPEGGVDAVERQLEEAIRRDTAAALETTVRDWGCDVYGFARMVKKKLPELVQSHEDEWPARLQSCRFEVEVSAQVVE